MNYLYKPTGKDKKIHTFVKFKTGILNGSQKITNRQKSYQIRICEAKWLILHYWASFCCNNINLTIWTWEWWLHCLISVYLCVHVFCTLFSDDMSTRSLVRVALNAWKMMNCEGIAWSGRGVIIRKPIFIGGLRLYCKTNLKGTVW